MVSAECFPLFSILPWNHLCFPILSHGTTYVFQYYPMEPPMFSNIIPWNHLCFPILSHGTTYVFQYSPMEPPMFSNILPWNHLCFPILSHGTTYVFQYYPMEPPMFSNIIPWNHLCFPILSHGTTYVFQYYPMEPPMFSNIIPWNHLCFPILSHGTTYVFQYFPIFSKIFQYFWVGLPSSPMKMLPCLEGSTKIPPQHQDDLRIRRTESRNMWLRRNKWYFSPGNIGIPCKYHGIWMDMMGICWVIKKLHLGNTMGSRTSNIEIG